MSELMNSDYRIVAFPSTAVPRRWRLHVPPIPIGGLLSPSLPRIIAAEPSIVTIGRTMPTIDWTQRDVIFSLAVSGLLLIVLSLVLRYWPAKRGSFLAYAIGIIGALVLGAAGGLYYLPPDPDWFSSSGAWYTVERGDVVTTAVEPGEVEPEDISYIECKLRAPNPSVAAGRIRWVAEEGTMVKKGDLLVALDDSKWQDQLEEKTMTRARRKFLEEQIANCRILAPRDGLVIYYYPERNGDHYNPPASFDELVREGQKLLSIYDLSKLVVKTRISQSQIVRVRLGQVARIHIYDFPNRTLEGRVSRIDPIPTKVKPGSQGTFHAVWLKPSGLVAELRPRMSAKVSLELARVDNVLCVPTEALLHSGDKTICFVKSGRQIASRMVHIGLSDSRFTVVYGGLKEGEEVLRERGWKRFSASANGR